jgi:hypothetical protein
VIHDFEMARWGGTSEDVEAGLADGTFGMAEETGREMNEAITPGRRRGGDWASLWAALWTRRPRRTRSTRFCWRPAARRPVHVHAAVGARDHPPAPGRRRRGHRQHQPSGFPAAGRALSRLEGGVVLNLGSAVIMPEVFLKALTVSRNLHGGRRGSSPPWTWT